MSNFMEARERAKEALNKQETLLKKYEVDLANHRENLKYFSENLTAIKMGSSVLTEAALEESILRETICVNALEREIRSIQDNIADIRRSLKTTFSLAPAIR